MSWVTVTMDPIDNKVKIDWIYIRKIVIGTVRKDQFLYILFEIGFKYNFDCHSKGSIPHWTALLDDHNHTSPLHLLTRILMKVFTRPRTT